MTGDLDLAALRARIQALRRSAGREDPGFDLQQDLQRLVLIGSSSRGGSSIFAEVLRRTVDAIHLRAESNPFLRLHGLAPAGEDPRGDSLSASDPCPSALFIDLGSECGQPARALPDAAARRAYAADLACRLSLQWPMERFELEELEDATCRVLGELSAVPGWQDGGFPDVQPFFVRLLRLLRASHPGIDPTLYDLDQDLVRREIPGAEPGDHVPQVIVEEPPFVAIGPWKPATREDLREKPLIIKTPSNAYRLPWFQAAFPRTRIALLHLTRNVAASVNGLFDGWQHRGFQAHHVPGRLCIPGYSDRVPGGCDWWKFDLPPGWLDQVSAPLQEVCAFQWRSAHAALLEGARSLSSVTRFRFEAFTADARAEVTRLLPWLGAGLYPGAQTTLESALPRVMATHQPRHRRWFARAALLEQVIQDPRNLELMDSLGYERSSESWS